jgi:hypothetical protein
VAAAVVAAIGSAGTARAASATLNTLVKMSDGVSLHATVTGAAPLRSRPLIVEFSPYGAGSGTTHDGQAYNYLLVQIRGTGDSGGEFDALGPRTQQDVVETLRWACTQPWSDGRLGLNGFSASAITVYNSLYLKLPCVRTAVLRSGTFELYRDLLWPGGVSNFIPGAGVLALIGAPAAAEGFGRAPVSDLDTAIGLFDAGINGGLRHPTLDEWWRERGFRGDLNKLPILMLDSFFDVESRGAFQAFQALRGDGAHLLVVGAHDGAPTGTDDGNGATKAWFDHYLLGAANGIQRPPRVQLLMADGSREGYLAGDFVRYHASDWPVPGTRWLSLWPSAARSGSGDSINDGSLVSQRPAASTTQPYAAIPTVPSMSDQPNTAIVGPDGINQAATAFPVLTETALAEPEALAYTTAPLPQDMLSAGPAALDLRLSSTTTETAIWAVISDVWPDGTSHPVATGRLLSAYPNIDRSRSLSDSSGNVVEPYGEYATKSDDTPTVERTYQIEFWPIGNRFKRGHRIRLVVLGASAASVPSAPALNTVRLGGPDASRLLLPVLPVGSGCALAGGRLRGRSLGPLRLGMTRAQAQRLLPRSSTRGRRSMVFFCLAPKGIRAGFSSPKLLRTLAPSERRRVRGRAILLLTAYRRYALRGVRPHTLLSDVARRLRVGRPFHIGLNWWYLVANGQSRGVLKVRHGIIEEIGVADRQLTSSRRAARMFLTSFR